MRHVHWFLAAAVVVAAAAGFAAVAAASEVITIEYPHDHNKHEQRHVIYINKHEGVSYAWLFNPDDLPVTYENDTYVPHVIHEGPWDVMQFSMEGAGTILLNGSDMRTGANAADLRIAEYLRERIDTLEAENDALRNQTAALESEDTKTWEFVRAMHKITFANAERMFAVEAENAALNATITAQQKTMTAMAERIAALERAGNQPPEPVPDAPLPPPE